MTKAAQMVTLQDLKTPRISIHLEAQLRSDGFLCLAGQDLGPEVEALTGEDEYEYFLTVKPAHVPGVLAALVRDSVGRVEPASTNPTDDERLLLEQLRRAYGAGRFTGRSDFAEFLDKNGVPYELFSC